MLKPLQLMWDRVERGKADSDTSFFLDLLYAGELVLKLTVAALVSSIEDDRDGHRYRLIHRLVRADGLGEWAQSLDDLLTGPASQFMRSEAKESRRALTERVGPESWQHQAVTLLNDVVKRVAPDVDSVGSKTALRTWFTRFPELRNKTRAHGAPTAALCASSCPALEKSIKSICEHNPLFHRQWAYLHRNLSGKYRVSNLGTPTNLYEPLKTSEGVRDGTKNLTDGIYIHLGAPVRVDLIESQVDVVDFFLPNGAFNGKTYELHSLITDNRRSGDAGPYLLPASERPRSETEGLGRLEVVGNTFGNLPPIPKDYVSRPALEQDLYITLNNDRHAIITLVGRGGIGKTSLALNVLHKLAQQPRFDAILWFSARDIDLLPSGAKVVRPHVLTEADIAAELINLLEPSGAKDNAFKPVTYLAECLATTPLGGPVLYVFDNFETVRSPVDLFNWIDANIRLPNKALITTRFRDFKADYPIAISGMEKQEADRLIYQTAANLGIRELITEGYRESVFEESDGHPYIIKIVLGEVADTKQVGKPARIIARKEELLDALFERTYGNLTPAAKRIFLTLSAWRSLVPQLALEAVLLRPQNDRMDVSASVDELLRMSLIQRTTVADGTDFLDVPLVAAVFGLKKLGVSPLRTSIESDLQVLREIGPTTETSLKHGIRPRIERLFGFVAHEIAVNKARIEDVQPMLELVSRSYPPGWLLLADLHEEQDSPETQARTAECLRRYLETEPDVESARGAWDRLARDYEKAHDYPSAADAYIRASELPGASLLQISDLAHWLNTHRVLLASHDEVERDRVLRRVIALFEPYIRNANANDLSRLAWLHLHVGDVKRAREVAELGLEKERSDGHCHRLIRRLDENSATQ